MYVNGVGTQLPSLRIWSDTNLTKTVWKEKKRGGNLSFMAQMDSSFAVFVLSSESLLVCACVYGSIFFQHDFFIIGRVPTSRPLFAWCTCFSQCMFWFTIMYPRLLNASVLSTGVMFLFDLARLTRLLSILNSSTSACRILYYFSCLWHVSVLFDHRRLEARPFRLFQISCYS